MALQKRLTDLANLHLVPYAAKAPLRLNQIMLTLQQRLIKRCIAYNNLILTIIKDGGILVSIYLTFMSHVEIGLIHVHSFS